MILFGFALLALTALLIISLGLAVWVSIERITNDE